jgi:5-carboxymethyl-2-hydroxymuconate isomerase
MPHCILEYSNNILETIDCNHFLQKLHHLLVKQAGVNVSNIKSRIIVYDKYYVGDGNKNTAFIHLTVSLLSGRSIDVKQLLGQKLLHYLRETFSDSYDKLNCSITLELREIEREAYFKVQ